MKREMEGRKSKAELRKFGLTLGIAFGVFSAVALWRGRMTTAAVLGAIGSSLLVGGIAIPGALGPV